jgi:hypothetical protein
MNFNIDPKALVKTAFVSPNDNNRSVRSAVQTLPGRVGFAQTLSQLQQKPGVNSSTFLNPQVPSMAVQEGDTFADRFYIVEEVLWVGSRAVLRTNGEG